MTRPVDDFISVRRLAFGGADRLAYPKDTDEANAYMQHRTIILQHLELDGYSFKAIQQAKRELLHREASVSSYISTPTSDAFGWHKDQWDSLIWQLSGEKTFHFEDHPPQTLQRGSLLFIRQGAIHKTASETHSVHLSLVALPVPDG